MFSEVTIILAIITLFGTIMRGKFYGLSKKAFCRSRIKMQFSYLHFKHPQILDTSDELSLKTFQWDILGTES